MKQQFNNKHNARQQKFQVEQPVFARHYRSQLWKPGEILNDQGVISPMAPKINSTPINSFQAYLYPIKPIRIS